MIPGERQTRELATKPGHAKWMSRLAKLGYAAKGVLYVVVGVLAVQYALGQGGSVTDRMGAIDRIREAPLGTVWLWVVAVGLLGLVAWRLAQSLGNVEGDGTGKKAAVKRVGLAISGFVHAGLLAATVRALTGGPAEQGGSAQSWTSRVMDAPFGRVMVLLAGLVIAGFGVSELIKAAKGKLEKRLNLEGIAARQARVVRGVSRFGVASRGVVFVLMGGFLTMAAVRHDPAEAKGLGDTLVALAEKPYGAILLGIVAAGLVAYGAYAFLEARYRRIELRGAA